MGKKISISELEQLIEPHLFEQLKSETYEVEVKPARQLLTYDRFDLAFKLCFLDIRDSSIEYAKELYQIHIKALTLGEYTEYGNEDKNSNDKYLDSFISTFNDVEVNGFDAKRTIIPLSNTGRIINGAHRIASAIYLNKSITCTRLDTDIPVCDYKFFVDRKVSTVVLDAAATKFTEYAENVHIAFIWPTAEGKDTDVEAIIPNIVYRKNIKLTRNGAHNLLSKTYLGEEWLGNIENNFEGVKTKLDACFMSDECLRVIAFQSSSLQEVLEIKDKVRALFNVGKHSIHITDDKEEAISTARRVFNDNSIHFLNYAHPNTFLSTYLNISKFKNFLTVNKVNVDDSLIDSSMTLSLYGIREANDIDCFVACTSRYIEFNDEFIDEHDSELTYHKEEKTTLIYNSNFYFYFEGLKFISFAQLYKMKKNRGAEKDVLDFNSMESLIENNLFKDIKNKLKSKVFYTKQKLKRSRSKVRFFIKQLPVKILKFIGVFEIVKKLYKKFF